MKINKKRLKLPIMTFIAMLLLSSTILGYVNNQLKKEQNNRMNAYIRTMADDMELAILSRINILRTAESLIIHSGYENFDDVFGNITMLPYIDGIVFAPNDIIDSVYAAGNLSDMIGKNIRGDEFGGNIENTNPMGYGLYLSGPFDYKDGKQVLVGRLPVYLMDENGKNSYWGMIAMGLTYPDVLNEIDFDAAISQGYSFRVSNEIPAKNEKHIIYESEKKIPEDSKPIVFVQDIMNTKWKIEIAPVSNTRTRLVGLVLIIGGVVISFLCAFALYRYLCKRDKKYYERKAEFDRQYLGVMTLLSSEYSSVYYVYPDLDTLIPYGMSARIKNLFGDSFKTLKYSEAIESYVEKAVKEEDKDTVRLILSEKYIKEQLKNQNTFFRYYLNNEDKYCELKCVRVEDQLEAFAVVLGFAEKDKEIRAELEAKEQLKEARQKAEAASVAKSTFLFNMSHDIRTPMNAIMGYTQMALKHSDDANIVEDCLEKVNISGDHLRRLINDILDVARIENGKIIINESVIDIREMCRELHAIISENANEKNISFNFTNDIKYHYIYIDRLRVSQIILNIVSNAIKFTSEGGRVDCILSQGELDSEGKTVLTLLVKDNGCGMSEEFLSHIYEAFVREKSSTVSGVQGSGLGMAITKQLIDIMGGDINIESKVGEGTSVTVKIRCRISGNGQNLSEKPAENINDLFADTDRINDEKFKNLFTAISDAAENAEEENTLSGKHVLVVEDTKLNMEITECILVDEGIIVDKAYDGEEAIEMVKSHPSDYYNIILMDVQMPVMNGYEATRRIKSISGYEDIPIVAMTANVFEEDKKAAFESGMCGHLSKPIDIFEMIETLKEKMR
ncbi:MAG: response regulator [Lachnospiraceae bacterium]|nr:response regulator [Lachnospiraceae bacterium]